MYYDIAIDRFWGTKDINQLVAYPLEYYLDGSEKEIDGLCKTLRDRGAKYNRIVRSKAGSSQMYVYGGPALSERRSVVKKKTKDNVRTSPSFLLENEYTNLRWLGQRDWTKYGR